VGRSGPDRPAQAEDVGGHGAVPAQLTAAELQHALQPAGVIQDRRAGALDPIEQLEPALARPQEPLALDQRLDPERAVLRAQP
jgi:hypothetical protein